MSLANGDPDWPAMEADYWENTKRARHRQDFELVKELAARQKKLDQGIMELYNRKAELQSAMEEVDDSIRTRKAEKETLLHEYDVKRAELEMQREMEDRSQKEYFERAREESHPKKEKGMTQGKSGAPENTRNLLNPVPHWTSVNGISRPENSGGRDQDRAQEKRLNLFGSVFHNPIEEDKVPVTPTPLKVAQRDASARVQTTTEGSSIKNSKGVIDIRSALPDSLESVFRSSGERHNLPVLSTAHEGSSGSPDHSSRNRKSLPSGREPSSQINSPPAEVAVHGGPDITRESLVLRDDGSTIIHPPIFAGVPLVKVDINHPFWNPEWEPLEPSIQATLDRWKQRLEALRENPNSAKATVFLANRQVNRGQTVLDFLKDGCFHPLQFANRETMDRFYKTFINYDTVFRLVNIYEELKKFDLEMTPLEWLRQRMYEKSVEDGDKFNLSKATHQLYHDEKLRALRERHGFGNIGRPSGYKVGDKSGTKGTVKLKPKKSSMSDTLDEQPSEGGTRRTYAQLIDDDEPLPHLTSLPTRSAAAASRPTKRQRSTTISEKQAQIDSLAAQEHEAAQADLDYEGYSSRDSFSNGRIMHLDFRVHQIRTRAMTTRQDITQYWTWKPEDMSFEHQVLREVHPNITWGHYRQPDKFNCRLKDMQEVHFSPKSLKIMITRADEAGGNILVNFKRERTKKRLLSFAKRKGVKLVTTSDSHIEESWQTLYSETISEKEPLL